MLRELRATNYRTARNVVLELGPVGAFIGQPGAGKSNLLAAVAAVLDPEVGVREGDVTRGEADLHIEATLADGSVVAVGESGLPLGVVVIPASLRAEALIQPTHHRGGAQQAAELFEQAMRDAPAPRVALVRALEQCAAAVSDVVFLLEEPELFLAPQAHRYMYRLFHRLAANGNQVLFTTHAPGLLNVSRLEEIHLVSRDPQGVTAVERLNPIEADDEFRAMCEFDAERSELFFSRAALLVEGMTERIAFPYVFQAMGHDIDRSAISIVDCGGKTNLPLFIKICRSAHIPYVAVFDTDVRGNKKQPPELLRLNRRLRRAAGHDRYVDINPDFEGLVGIRGRSNKPEHALRAMRRMHPDELPFPLRRAVELTVEAARPRARFYS